MGPAGFIAVLAGWTTTEVGRQPFTVFGVLRTADSTSPIALPAVATSFAAFVVVYSIVFGTGFVYILHLMRRPPGVGTTETGVLQAGAMPADALGPGPHAALGG
jgi:cytochrome d ubiquinol oxidase subunit I